MANYAVPNTITLDESVVLTKSSVTMTGSSGVLVAADADRKVLIICSTKANSDAAFDPTGGTCALDSGMPISGGDIIQFKGLQAQSAFTQIGTNGQKLTIYTGKH